MSSPSAVRGEHVDIGGRTLRVVRAGPPGDQPLVVCEHGAFGCASDWAVVAEKLALRGLRTLAYDRAGLGFSEPGPAPRDGAALRADRAALLTALGETGPFVSIGHSMGGLMARLFALERPDAVLGLVLVDAITPDMIDLPGGGAAVSGFSQILRLASVGAQVGLMHGVSRISANLIGLTGEAAREKQEIHALASHARWAAEEVAGWRATSALAAAELPPDLPVAVITAGAMQGWNPLKARQVSPAEHSRRGYVEHVADCNHANLLGPDYAETIVRAVDHVLAS